MKKFKLDKLREECGIFGISNHQDASALVALGLHALQHRGQEGCGIVSYDGKNYHSEKRQGLVGDHFTKSDVIKKLPGKICYRSQSIFYYRRNIFKKYTAFFCRFIYGWIKYSS